MGMLMLGVRKVNRGGLFEVNDTAFSLFCEIELTMRDRLSAILKSSPVETDQKDRLMKLVCEDEDVQFYWSMLSLDIDTEQNAALHLKEIVELWLTIRGFQLLSGGFSHGSMGSMEPPFWRTE